MSGPRTNQAPNHGPPSGPDHADILDQLEAHALGALDRTDAGIVEQHLRWCAPCRDQAKTTRDVVDLLPLALAPDDAPSTRVKRALLSRVAADERELPYEPPMERAHLEGEDRGVRAPSATVVPSRTRAAVSGRTPSRWVRFVPPAIIAPLALALIVLGAWANSMRLDLADQERETALANEAGLNQIVANGGAVQLYSMEPRCDDCPARGRLGVDQRDNMGVLVAWGLDPDLDHQVWCVDTNGDKVMVSTLDVEADGGAMQAFAFPSEKVSEFTEVYVAQKDGGPMYMVDLAPDDGTPPAT